MEHTTAWECGAQDCGLRFASPQLPDQQLRAAYQSLYYPGSGNGHAPAYENTPSEILSEVVARLFTRLDCERGHRLLDFGCGNGNLCRVAREFGLRPTGVEADEQARRTASQEHGVPVFESLDQLVAADPGSRFDVIVLWQAIEHLRAPWEDLRRLVPLLEKGGSIVIATPNSESLKARLWGRRWVNFQNQTHFFYFTDLSLQRVLSKGGLEVCERWFVPEHYPHHGPLRISSQQWLRRMRLNGELLFVSRVPR